MWFCCFFCWENIWKARHRACFIIFFLTIFHVISWAPLVSSFHQLSFSDKDFMSLTWTQNPQGRSVIFLHPLLSIIQQQAYRRRCAVELINLQPLHHLPVTTCKSQTGFLPSLPALTRCCKRSAERLTAKAGAVTTVSTQQKPWQLIFPTLDSQMFLGVVHTQSRAMELTSPEQAGHTKQVSKSLLPHPAKPFPTTSSPGSGYTGVLSNRTEVAPLQSGPYTT